MTEGGVAARVHKVVNSESNFHATIFDSPRPSPESKTGVIAPNCPFFCRIYSKSCVSILADSKRCAKYNTLKPRLVASCDQIRLPLGAMSSPF
jgi:hypothetical protein